MAARGTRREVADAARRLLQDKVDVAADLAEAGVAINAAEDALRAAQEGLEAARGAYAEQYQRALSAGWTDDQLAQLGCPADRAGVSIRARSKPRRRRTAPAAQGLVRPESSDDEASSAAPPIASAAG